MAGQHGLPVENCRTNVRSACCFSLFPRERYADRQGASADYMQVERFCE